MLSLVKMGTTIVVVFISFLIAPLAMALPATGALKEIHKPRAADAPAIVDETNLKALVKEAGFRIRIRVGRFYPRYRSYRRYGYYGYYPRYRSYRSKRRYKRRFKRRRSLRRHRRYRRFRF